MSDAKPPYVVVTRYDPGNGKKVITHVYGGPWVEAKHAYRNRKKIMDDVGDNPAVEVVVTRMLPVHG